MTISRKPADSALLLLICIAFAVILGRNAWIGDDAYITFRTVDNFINGLGLTWNAGERVQAYTHPLWMILMSMCYFVTREVFFTCVIVSIVISTTAVLVLAFRVARTPFVGALVVLTLILSKAFIDYSTSGLENPLTHLLLVVFFMLFLSRDGSTKNTGLLAFVAGLAILNRPDNFLLVAPALVYWFWLNRSLRSVAAILIGLSLIHI